MPSLFRQRLVELAARDLLGASRAQIAGWRKVGGVAHQRRFALLDAAAREGLRLERSDLDGWERHHEKRETA
jgi:hypothetical protein